MSDRCTKAVHTAVFANGAAIFLPPYPRIVNLQIPPDDAIYEQSSDQLYPLGTKLEFADGRLFRYGKIGATSTSPPIARMVVNANAAPGCTNEEDVDGYEGDPYVAAAIGATHVDLEIATAYAAGFFEDGMLSVFPSGHYVEYRIHDNDLGDGTYCRIYIDAPLKTALAADTGVTAYKSIFSQMKVGGAEGTGYTSVIGACLADTFTADYYAWVQRRGRCIVTPTAYFGDGANERMAQLHSDGTIALKAADGTHTVGYLTQRTVSGYGDLEVWLTLE